MHQSDPTLLPVHALSAAIQARRLSPVDVVEAYLGRIEAHEPKLQAFVDIYAEDARLAAAGVQRGRFALAMRSVRCTAFRSR